MCMMIPSVLDVVGPYIGLLQYVRFIKQKIEWPRSVKQQAASKKTVSPSIGWHSFPCERYLLDRHNDNDVDDQPDNHSVLLDFSRVSFSFNIRL